MSGAPFAVIFIGRDYEPEISFVSGTTGNPWPLPGTYSIRFYVHDNPVAVLEATLANGRISSLAASVATMNIPAATMAVFTDTFGSCELVRTDAGLDVVTTWQVRYVPFGVHVPNGLIGDLSVPVGSGLALVQLPAYAGDPPKIVDYKTIDDLLADTYAFAVGDVATAGGVYYEVVEFSGLVTAGGNYLERVSPTVGGAPTIQAQFIQSPYTYSASDPIPVKSWHGVEYGLNGTSIYKRSARGAAWTLHCATPDATGITSMWPVIGGEVVLVTPSKIFRSVGWASGPVTWTEKIVKDGASAVLLQFGAGPCYDGTNMIVSEYAVGLPGPDWEDSEKAWASRDGGVTWSTVYNSFDLFGAAQDTNSHVHGAAYDPNWNGSGMWIVVEGHSTSKGVYISRDPFANPLSWVRIANGPFGGGTYDGQPTNVIPLPHGVVLASDSSFGQGLWVIERGLADDGSDAYIRQLLQWPSGYYGVAGFGASHDVDLVNGVAYIGYTVTSGGIAADYNSSIVVSTDGASAEIAWNGGSSFVPAAAGDQNSVERICVTPWGEVDINIRKTVLIGPVTTQARVTGALRAMGAQSDRDTGSLLGGRIAPGVLGSSASGHGSYIGPLATRSNADGTKVRVLGPDSAAFGVNIETEATSYNYGFGVNLTCKVNSFTMGFNLKNGGTSVIIGGNRDLSSYPNTLSVGWTQTITASGTYYGQTLTSSGAASAIFGAFSSSAAYGGGVFGENSRVLASHQQSTVLGPNKDSTSSFELTLGANHIWQAPLAANPAFTPPSGAYEFWFLNGSSKLEKRVKTPSGTTHIMWTEP